MELSLMFQQMVFISEPVLAFSITTFNGTIDVLLEDVVCAVDMFVDLGVGFDCEGRSTAAPIAPDIA